MHDTLSLHSSFFVYEQHSITDWNLELSSLVIKINKKGESQNGCYKKTKKHQIFRKTNISYLLIVCVSGGKKCLFFGKFGKLCFLATPVLRFALLLPTNWSSKLPQNYLFGQPDHTVAFFTHFDFDAVLPHIHG